MFRHPHSMTGMMAKGVRKAKADSQWERGVWLGKVEKTDEHLVATEAGLYKARDARRLVLTRQVDAGLVLSVSFPPWAPVWGPPPGRRVDK